MASQSFSNCTLTVLTVFMGSLLQPFFNCTTLNFFPFYAYIFIELELQVPRYSALCARISFTSIYIQFKFYIEVEDIRLYRLPRTVCAYIFHFYIYTVLVLYSSV